MHVGPLCPHSSCSPASAVCHHRQPSIATVEFIVREREQQHREPVRPTHAKFPWPCGEEAVVCPSACVSALHSRTLFAGPPICPISRHFGRPTRATNISRKGTAHSFSTTSIALLGSPLHLLGFFPFLSPSTSSHHRLTTLAYEWISKAFQDGAFLRSSS